MPKDSQRTTQEQSEESIASASPKPSKTSGKKKMSKKRGKQSGSKKTTKAPTDSKLRSGGAARPFPSATFESVLSLARTIFNRAGASREMKRVTVFNLLGKSPESSTSRMLVINSSRYGLTIGGKDAEIIKITDDAVRILDPRTPLAESIRAKFILAIEGIPPFKALYERFKGGRLPALEVMKDSIQDVAYNDRQECVDIFIGNAKYVGLIDLVDGAEWIRSLEQVLEKVGAARTAFIGAGADESKTTEKLEGELTEFDSICFFIAPIDEDGSPKRKHSDFVLETLVEPAIEPFHLRVIRADKITAPGMISKQVIEHILKSKLVIVDMSFHNPNVFYELAIRHMLGKPTVHLVRKNDGVPFDVGNFRTIYIDDSDLYDLMAKRKTYRVDIANFAREALEGSSSSDNPILTFFPELKVTGLLESQ